MLQVATPQNRACGTQINLSSKLPKPLVCFSLGLTLHPSVYRSYVSYLGTLPPALAAISALTAALPLHHITTAAEAVSLLSNLSTALKRQLNNPIPVSAGTDSFLHYLVTTVARPGAEGADIAKAIESVAQVGKAFVTKGEEARATIGRYGKRVVRDGCTVVVPAADELVRNMLIDAAEADIDFRVVFVEDAAGSIAKDVSNRLNEQQIAWTSIRPEALAHTLTCLLTGQDYRHFILLTGASALLATGGVLAPMGVSQAAVLAKAFGIDVFVASELQKSVKWMPLAGEEAKYGTKLQWSDTKDTATSSNSSPASPKPDEIPMDVTVRRPICVIS